MWRDIAATNPEEIRRALDALIEQLRALRGDLDEGQVLEQLFEDAARRRSELVKPRS